jgi:hypothetical protein
MPDRREINGQRFWISSWIKEGKDGRKFMSLAFRPKDEQPAKPATKGNFHSPLDNDLPF